MRQNEGRPGEGRGGAGDQLGSGVDGQDNDLAAWAATYAASGLPVIPLHSIRGGGCTCGRDCGRDAGKHPLTCHGKDDATIDAGQVARWWQWWPWANIGIRPPAGVVVLDVDPRNGGDTALHELTVAHAPLPATLTARTGSGGLHIWLAFSGTSRGTLCTGVDVKTERGYVVAPPSLHRSGGQYEWLAGLPTARAPGWVCRLLSPPPLPVSTPRQGGKGGDGLVRTVASATEGNRNNVLFWAACRAYERHGGDRQLLEDLVAAAVSAGLDEHSARRTVASAARTVGTGAVA